jgi:hypothetical protein
MNHQQKCLDEGLEQSFSEPMTTQEHYIALSLKIMNQRLIIGI